MSAPGLPLIGLSTYREKASWGVWSQRADILHHEYADSVVAAGAPGLAELGIAPHAIEAIVPSYLARYRQPGRRPRQAFAR